MKRYAIWSRDLDTNLYKDGRTFKNKHYARKVLLETPPHIDTNLFVKEVEVMDPQEENEELRKCIKRIKSILKTSTYNRSLQAIENCIKNLEGSK